MRKAHARGCDRNCCTALYECPTCGAAKRKCQFPFKPPTHCTACIDADRGDPVPGQLGMFKRPPNYVIDARRANYVGECK